MNQIKIPLWIAVLINVNIVIGSAFFLGASKIPAASGLLAPFAWILCGFMLLPLVLVLAKLAAHYPTAGGIYVYSQKQLGSLWGFISGWGYFIGTVAANAVVLHAFSTGLQNIGPIKQYLGSYTIPSVYFDMLLVIVFTLFNLMNIEFLERMQILFTILKGFPFLLVLVALPFLFNATYITHSHTNWQGLMGVLPLVLFAYVGIEACCAIADKIEDGQKNAAKVILLSFGLIILIYSVLQFALFCIHGSTSLDPFYEILPMLTKNQAIINWGNGAISLAILSSFLAGFYGMFYFNNWNLYAIGKDNSLVFSRYFTKLNKNQAPWVCILAQAALVILFLFITQESDYLIILGDLCTTIAYFLSVISFLTLYRSLIGFLALISCAALMFICSSNLISAGLHFAIPFIIILTLGLLGHLINTKK